MYDYNKSSVFTGLTTVDKFGRYKRFKRGEMDRSEYRVGSELEEFVNDLLQNA